MGLVGALMPLREPRTGWQAPLSKPLVLRDGRWLLTLADARLLILGLHDSDQTRNASQKAIELMMAAAADGDTTAATDQVETVLFLQAMLRSE